MGELFITIFVFIAVGGIAGALLIVWIVLNIAQLIRRTIAGWPSRPQLEPNRNGCTVPNCRAINPPAARFCRRCGHPIGEPVITLPREPIRPTLRRRQWQMMREM